MANKKEKTTKPKTTKQISDYESSIRNYANEIETIKDFAEAVRRIP